MPKRTAILISGRGSNMSSLIAAAMEPDYPARIELVLSNRPDAAGLERARGETGQGSDRFEDADISYHKKIRTAFRAIARSEPGRCVLINARKSPDAVAKSIWKEVSLRFDLDDEDD